MSVQRVLLNDAPGQKFSTVVGGTRINFEFRYNPTSERFYFDVTIDDVKVLQGRTLVENVDLFDAFPELSNQFGKFFCVDIDDKGREPTLENIANGNVRVFLKSGE